MKQETSLGLLAAARAGTATLFAALLMVAIPAQAKDWRNLRGPGYDGGTTGLGTLADSAELELQWKHVIGPGYSGVTVSGGRAVSAFSDGTNDVLVAWSAVDGRELWRTPIGPTHRGHDGSSDGPIGTATLTDSHVYFVGPFGDLLALGADSGAILWRKDLKDEWGASDPFYGFAAIPLEAKGVLVVPVGAEEHSIVGLDPEDGRLVWSLGTDRIGYSTPVLADGGDGRRVIVAGSQDLVALDAASGRLEWSHRHSEEPQYDPTYPQLQVLGERILLTFADSAVLYETKAKPEETEVVEIWRSTALKRSVALPVVVDDHLYGFSGTFLTCVKLATGETVWKTRALKGRGIIRVDDYLVVLGTGGQLTLARADPAGYREIASLNVSDHGGYTAPSFAAGRIFVRNRTEIASVAMGASAGSEQSTQAASWPASSAIAAWMQRIEEAADPGKLVGRFLVDHPEFPIVEPDWVHFFYAGPAEAVSIIGQMNDAERGDPMTRVGRSDLFVRSYPSVIGGRWQYRIQVDLAEAGVDPRNPNRGSGGFEETSEVLLAGFADPDFVTDEATETGRLEILEVSSSAYDTSVPVQVYLPAGFDPEERYALIVMPNGTQWIEHGRIVGILDRLFELRSHAAIVALVPMQNWVGGSWGESALTFLGQELLPAIEAAYPIRPDARHRTLWTVEDKAAPALTIAVEKPELYGRFAFQSPKLYFSRPPDVASLVEQGTAFRISWSRYEKREGESGTDERTEARQLFEHVRDAGLPVEGGEFIAGPGYRTWRTEADAIL
ncbi:MAG: PQQ-binding-like beta-propeller repeat protein, partial [Thermoanaerobaculia bacterium]|nr:PQQ-binding-like beta-propeller repeat protein [Thermoanaerobaculia bacterium]